MSTEKRATPAIPKAPDEAKRLLALQKYELMDAQDDPDFSLLAELAAQICEAPQAFISVVDEINVFYKASVGCVATPTPRDASYCTWTIFEEEILHIPDLTLDPRTANMAITVGPPHYRMYCGANLVTDEGFKLGTLCVVDFVPHQLSGAQQRMLLRMAKTVVDMMESRIRHREVRTTLAALRAVNSNKDMVSLLQKHEENSGK